MTVVADADRIADRIRGRSTVFLSLLPPLGGDRLLALSIAALSAVIFVALVPFAKEPLAPMPGFIPVYQSALFFCDLITAAVFFGQYSIQHTRALLLLGIAYLFTALMVVPHTLSFPGLFAETGVIGSGPQTTVWLYMFWHSGFPLLMMVFAFVKDDGRPMAAPAKTLLLSIGGTVAAVLALIALTTTGHSLLPTLLMPDNSYTPAMTFLILAVWG
jgi:two-component system sensor histidine kinase/response regulator